MLQKHKTSKKIARSKRHSYAKAELSELRNLNERSIVLLDTSGRIIFANQEFVRSIDKTLSNAVGLPICTLLSREYAALLSDRMTKVVSTGMPENFEIVKGTRCTEYSLFPLCDSGGIVQLALVGIDLTERKKAEEALDESREMLRLPGHYSRAGLLERY